MHVGVPNATPVGAARVDAVHVLPAALVVALNAAYTCGYGPGAAARQQPRKIRRGAPRPVRRRMGATGSVGSVVGDRLGDPLVEGRKAEEQYAGDEHGAEPDVPAVGHVHDGRPDEGHPQDGDPAHVLAQHRRGVVRVVRVPAQDQRPVRVGGDEAVQPQEAGTVRVVDEEHLAEQQCGGFDRPDDGDVAGVDARFHRAAHHDGRGPSQERRNGCPHQQTADHEEQDAGQGGQDQSRPTPPAHQLPPLE